MDSLGPLGCPTLPGLPGSFAVLSLRAVPNHPGRLGGCTCSFLPRRFQASSTLEDWPPSSCVTRPNRIRGYSGSQVCIPGFHRHGCPRQLRCRYMRVRTIRMMNSFQFTRSARLTLVYQSRQVRRENNAKPWERIRGCPHDHGRPRRNGIGNLQSRASGLAQHRGVSLQNLLGGTFPTEAARLLQTGLHQAAAEVLI